MSCICLLIRIKKVSSSFLFVSLSLCRDHVEVWDREYIWRITSWFYLSLNRFLSKENCVMISMIRVEKGEETNRISENDKDNTYFFFSHPFEQIIRTRASELGKRFLWYFILFDGLFPIFFSFFFYTNLSSWINRPKIFPKYEETREIARVVLVKRSIIFLWIRLEYFRKKGKDKKTKHRANIF